jgi:serine/threonine protein kinase
MKLGDFGCSVCTEGLRKTVVSCLEYSSPEQLSGGAYNEKIDVWGIGILAYELLTGKSPFEKEIMNMANENIDFSCIKFPPELKISELAKDFITSLLNVDPIDRLDVDEALEHKFITSNYE